jgi:hypothetical protein
MREAMQYEAEISRENPTCFLFVIDQSGSMDEMTEAGRSKANFVADVLNKTLYTLVTTCSKADGVRNYFDVGVIAYGGSEVTTGFGGALSEGIVHPIQAISEHTLRVEERKKKMEDGAGGIVELKTKFPIWFDPKSAGGTPMRAALNKTMQTVADWCERHPASYPPTILHVTDGQSTDGAPEEAAEGLRRLSTRDGQALLFNMHVTAGGGLEIIFAMSTREHSFGCRARCRRTWQSLPATRVTRSLTVRAASSSMAIHNASSTFSRSALAPSSLQIDDR